MEPELKLDDWRGMRSAPRDSSWILVKLWTGEVCRAHYACGGGEDSPVFDGWFRTYEGSDSYYECRPVAWHPL